MNIPEIEILLKKETKKARCVLCTNPIEDFHLFYLLYKDCETGDEMFTQYQPLIQPPMCNRCLEIRKLKENLEENPEGKKIIQQFTENVHKLYNNFIEDIRKLPCYYNLKEDNK